MHACMLPERRTERAGVVDAAACRVLGSHRVDRPELGRQRPFEGVEAQIDILGVVPPTHLCRDLAADLVPRQVDVSQVLEIAELRNGQVAAQAVAAQIAAPRGGSEPWSETTALDDAWGGECVRRRGVRSAVCSAHVDGRMREHVWEAHSDVMRPAKQPWPRPRTLIR